MSTHRIATTRFGCGCTVHTEPDVNGITPWLEHCARHAAAPEMLARLREYVDAYRDHPERLGANSRAMAHFLSARALLARLDAEGTRP